ncbi:MAG: flagellar export chaperone FlgN [Desulfobacteraceae bacterium]|nr:flagellar export chaperone FlgN [Desulfobacteraceae bacterium]
MDNDPARTYQELGRLPRLTGAFWSLAGSAVKAWQDMRAILVEERGVLISGDFRLLLDIAEKKKRKAEEIDKAERAVATMADMILERCGAVCGEGRWDALFGLVNRADMAILDSWLTSLRLARENALSLNQRNERWVKGQLKMARELLGILAGDASRKTATYDSTARANGGGSIYKLGVI